MGGKKMEGSEEQKRKKAREAKEEGMAPSEAGATSGSSKQREKLGNNEDHKTKIENIRKGKQDIISENTPEPKPGYKEAEN